MTVVVSDTSPLNYLVQIKCEHLLPALYEHVLIPAVVLQELENTGTPAIVRTWLSRLPEWIVVREAHALGCSVCKGRIQPYGTVGPEGEHADP
jgi:predicted nucleic acid-binding protein